MGVKELMDKFREAVKYYNLDLNKSVSGWKPPYFEMERLVYCYENKYELSDFNYWNRYSLLLDEDITYKEYNALEVLYDGDPFDIKEDDEYSINELKETLQSWRAMNLYDKGYMDIFDELGYLHYQNSLGEMFCNKNGRTITYNTENNPDKKIFVTGEFSKLEIAAIYDFMKKVDD